MPPQSGCMFILPRFTQSEVGFLGTVAGEIFRSGEVRPLVADWSLRARLKSLLHLEARPLITSFLLAGPISKGASRLPTFLQRSYSFGDRFMLPECIHTTQPNPTRIGVGIDTSRYGHYAAFVRDDLQAAAGELQFAESAAGYAQLRGRLQHLATQHGTVHFLIRLDAAGQYADNLLHFLHRLAADGSIQGAAFAISCGDPQRNKNYHSATPPST